MSVRISIMLLLAIYVSLYTVVLLNVFLNNILRMFV